VLQSGKFHGMCSVKQLFPYASALDGQSIESYLGVALYGNQGDIIGVLCILHHQSISNPQRVEEALRIFAERAASELERRRTEVAMRHQLNAIEAEIDGIGILKEDTFVYVNQAYVRLFGYDQPDDIVGKRWTFVHPLSTIERFENHVFPTLERDLIWQGEAVALRKNGTTFPEGLSLTLTEDGLVICVCRDISELKQAQEQIVYNALHDPLTGLPNRTLLLERLECAINRAHRLSHYHYAVLFLDLDRFKIINDSLGHDVGDQLLIAMAQQLTSHVHNIDLVARIGGDEFVILLEDVDHVEEVVHIAEQILTRSQTPIRIKEHQVFTSMSIGIVLGNNTYHHATDVIRDADIAMCRAKLKTNNSYKFFDATMHIQALNRLSLETDLRQALEKGNLVLQYQPIVQLHDQKLVGFEALVRWPHPTRGMIEPTEFVSIAEETGLIASLDHWVLHQACRQMAEWKARFSRSVPLSISINLSVQNLRQPSLLENIDNILVDTGLDAHAIVLEITESMLIEDIDQTINLLDQLALRHIQVCIDDFGSGYSSLNYLHRLPVHHLKIDSGFVHQLQSDVRNYQVVSTIIALSKQLGLSVVAEGIETDQQLGILQQLGCTFGQGYLFSSSLGVTEIENKYF
ncbi:MAG: EAL domain-containing protein, partial [Cyanobacteria bacterium P01_A01_bin.37]